MNDYEAINYNWSWFVVNNLSVSSTAIPADIYNEKMRAFEFKIYETVVRRWFIAHMVKQLSSRARLDSCQPNHNLNEF